MHHCSIQTAGCRPRCGQAAALQLQSPTSTPALRCCRLLGLADPHLENQSGITDHSPRREICNPLYLTVLLVVFRCNFCCKFSDLREFIDVMFLFGFGGFFAFCLKNGQSRDLTVQKKLFINITRNSSEYVWIGCMNEQWDSS